MNFNNKKINNNSHIEMKRKRSSVEEGIKETLTKKKNNQVVLCRNVWQCVLEFMDCSTSELFHSIALVNKDLYDLVIEFTPLRLKFTSDQKLNEVFKKRENLHPERFHFLNVNCARLTHLELSNCGIDNNDVERFGALTRLTHLKLDNNFIGNDGMKSISNLSNLTYLDVKANPIDENSFIHISKLKNLTHLEISGERAQFNVNDHLFQHLSELSNLQSLTIHGIYISRNFTKFISRLTNLTMLDLTGCKIDWSDLVYFLSLTKLTLLNLSNCESVTGHSDLSNLKNLTDLNSCSTANDISHFSNLVNSKKLDLDCSYGKPGISHLSTMMNLTDLNLTSFSIGNEPKQSKNVIKLKNLNLCNTDFNSKA